MQANTQRTEQTFDLNSLLHTPPCEREPAFNCPSRRLLQLQPRIDRQCEPFNKRVCAQYGQDMTDFR